MLLHLLVACEDPDLRRRLPPLLAPGDAEVDLAPPGRKSLDPKVVADLVVLDDAALGADPAARLALLRELPDAPVLVVLTAATDLAEHARLLAAGAHEVLAAGLADALLREALAAVVSRLARERRRPPSGPAVELSLADFRSRSLAGARLHDLARRVARSESTVLISGETGVGKDHLARAIHAAGPRAAGPFVAVNCGAIPEALLESELFGHEQGAFTGATRSRRGLFEHAHRGTLFLDEVAELPAHLQVKLLRAIQQREIRRVGGERDLTLDVRIIAATNRPVGEPDHGGLRADLYFRLSVVTLEVPPLRERREDVPALARRLLDVIGPRLGRAAVAIDDEALDELARHDWPGNVRELQNVLERALILGDGARIRREDLAARPSSSVAAEMAASGAEEGGDDLLEIPLAEARRVVVDAFERRYLTALLRRERGRVGRAAAAAGVDPRSLYAALRRLGIRKEDFRV
ncbi:MAG: sigma-54 dependent transcriptional regulator [Planctomycetota bacterium]